MKALCAKLLRIEYLLLYLFSFLCLLPINSTYAQKAKYLSDIQNYIDGEVLVKFKEKISTENLAKSIINKGDTRLKSLIHKGIVRVKLKKGKSVEDAIAEYSRDIDVEFAQPNYIYRIETVPNDPSYSQMWGLRNTGQTITDAAYSTNNPGVAGFDMNLETAWNEITDCTSIVVAVIDSGVNYNHQDLAGNMWDDGSGNKGYDFIDNNSDPMDKNGHGTHCAGTIGAIGNNALGTIGICWQVQIMAVRVLDTVGVGSTATIISGIDYAVNNNADILNMSLGMEGEPDQALSQALDNARDQGVIVIAAAGNSASDNDTTAHWPSSYTHNNLISVAALDQNYELADFSNWGKESVDVGST